MYIPKINAARDRAGVLAFMQQFSFATIVTVNQQLPVATHLPFVITERNNQLILTSHFARANEQWKDLADQQVLVIFTEPHAYISTSNYDKELNVPTWNYIAVHAYGRASVLSDPAQALSVINKTINTYEESYRQQWEAFPEEYKSKMLKGIVAFEILVDDLQAKEKLSQNRSHTEQEKIISSLSASADTNEQLIAGYMARNRQP